MLRRSARLSPHASLHEASQEDRIQAEEIAQVLDGLPLALDQAGAYIEQTGCRLSGYLEMYRLRSIELLQQRGTQQTDYPATVATTWSLSFERVARARPLAPDLLAFYSYLYPDAIPEEIIAESAPALGTVLQPFVDTFELNAVLRKLLKFSLLQRHTTSKTLTMHRLVQAILRQRIPEEEQRLWAEQTVFVVDYAFPAADYKNWSRCERYLPHAQVCIEHIDRWHLAFPAVVWLLNQTGDYFRLHAHHGEAEACYQRALVLCERLYETAHPDTAGESQ